MWAYAVHAVTVELASRRRTDVEREELAEVPGRGQQEPRADHQVAEAVVVGVVRPSLVRFNERDIDPQLEPAAKGA